MSIGETIRGLAGAVKNGCSKLAGTLRENRLAVIITGGALLVILVLLLVLAVVRGGQETKDGGGAEISGVEAGSDLSESYKARDLAPEDFFLPDEPDFVPEVLLEREPKNGWVEEDARPYWTDPLEGNEEKWLDRIEKDIDSMLENVP